MMEFKAYIKNIRISPKKLRFLLAEIKKLKPADSLTYLFYTPQKSAKILYKAIKSAIDNAKNLSKIDENLLKFKVLTVEQGFSFKRYQPGGRGTIKPFKKRTAHIKIVLEQKDKDENQKDKLLAKENLKEKNKDYKKIITDDKNKKERVIKKNKIKKKLSKQ